MGSTTESTHFGFQQVKPLEKTQKVGQVFTSVAKRYDLMNDLMSFGLHRIWKHITNLYCQIKPGQVVLDLAGGTGDLTQRFLHEVGPLGHVYLADINAAMLAHGRDRLLNQGVTGRVSLAQVNAETLPFADNSFDCVCIGFGLRNVTHIDQALKSMYRVLKPGGRVVILEFSKPRVPGLQALYDLYSFKYLPKLGQWIAGDSESYRYLAESIRMHPDQNQLREMMMTAGLEDCEYFNLSGGIVAVHRGYKY